EQVADENSGAGSQGDSESGEQQRTSQNHPKNHGPGRAQGDADTDFGMLRSYIVRDQSKQAQRSKYDRDCTENRHDHGHVRQPDHRTGNNGIPRASVQHRQRRVYRMDSFPDRAQQLARLWGSQDHEVAAAGKLWIMQVERRSRRSVEPAETNFRGY